MRRIPALVALTVRADRFGLGLFRETVWILIVTIAFVTGLSRLLSWICDLPVAGVCSHRNSQIWMSDAAAELMIYRPQLGLYQQNLESGQVVQLLSYLPGDFSRIAVSRDGATILICSPLGHCILQDEGQEIPLDWANLKEDIVEILVSDDGSVACCVTADGTVHGSRRGGDGWYDWKIPGSIGRPLLQSRISPDGQRLLLACHDGTILVRELAAEPSEVIRFQTSPALARIDWSRDERLIVVVTRNNRVLLHDGLTGILRRELQLERSPDQLDSARTSVSPDGRYIAVAPDNAADIIVWDLDLGTQQHLVGHTTMVRSMVISSDSRRLYAASFDGTIREWSLETGAHLRVVSSETNPGRSAEYDD